MFHDFYDTIDGSSLYLWAPVNNVHGDVVVSVKIGGRAGDLSHPQVVDGPGCCHGENLDPALSGLLCHLLDSPAWISCHVAVSDDHREERGVRPRVVLRQLVGHVFQGAVDVGALSQVPDPAQVPDEVGPGGELAEDDLRLGEMQASDGPADLDLALVLLVGEPLGEDLGELFDVFHQDPRRRLLQGDGLRGVDGEEQLDGTVDYSCLTMFRSWCGLRRDRRRGGVRTVSSPRNRPGPMRGQILRDCCLEHA